MKYPLIIVIIISASLPDAGANFVECPGLPSRPGIKIECLSTKLGAVKFNCSNPMPVDTVAHYSCQPYYKETQAPNFFQAKSIRCNQQGRWARYNYFREFKCEYECGKAMPSRKTSIVRHQLKSQTTWSWHALIYLKLSFAEISDAIEYRKRILASPDNRRNDDDIVDENGYEEHQYSRDENFALNPVTLAEIFDNGDFTREESFDPQYRYIYICGGTLITDTMILTAAHCMTDFQGRLRTTNDFIIVLGGISNNFYENVKEPKSQIIPVGRIHLSNDFNYNEYRSDIAIVELLYPAVINGIVLPACLPENRDDSQLFIANKKHGEAVGSMINIYKEGVSSELKSKKLQVLPNIDCVKNIQRIPSDKEFCAGSLGNNICSGDSGGGLIATPNFGLRRRYTVQGIISYARTKRVCENYAVFTRVYKFMSWIKSIIYSNDTVPVFIPMPL